MGLSDKLKQLGDKAKESAAEHREQIGQAVESAGVMADKRTRGKYSDQIAKAASKTAAAVDRLAGSEQPGTDAETATGAQPKAGPAAPAPSGDNGTARPS